MSSTEEVPHDVLHFLDSCVDSVEQLYILLLMYEQPNRKWTVAEMNAHLRSTETSILKRLDGLYSRKVLLAPKEGVGTHQFKPCSDEISVIIQKLAEQHRTRPYRVIEAIYSRPNKVLQIFADAFKIRGDQ